MKRKLLAKIASALSSLAILATATIPTLPSITPLVAHAEYNGGGDSNSGGTGNKNGGPGWGNVRASGLRIYVTSPIGNIQIMNHIGNVCNRAVLSD